MQPASQTTESPATEKKTPLTRKRIGLIGLTFLLVMGILLMPIRVTQNEAKAADPATTSVIVVATLYVVHTCVRWAIGRTLDAATKRDLAANGGTTPTDAIARAKVNGAQLGKQLLRERLQRRGLGLLNSSILGNVDNRNGNRQPR